MVCEPKRSQFHVRDSLIGAGVMIGATAVFASAGLVLRRSGWPMTGEILRSLAFSAPLMLSMPSWVLKGQPWRCSSRSWAAPWPFSPPRALSPR